jgi:hypothetical protein
MLKTTNILKNQAEIFEEKLQKNFFIFDKTSFTNHLISTI